MQRLIAIAEDLQKTVFSAPTIRTSVLTYGVLQMQTTYLLTTYLVLKCVYSFKDVQSDVVIDCNLL